MVIMHFYFCHLFFLFRLLLCFFNLRLFYRSCSSRHVYILLHSSSPFPSFFPYIFSFPSSTIFLFLLTSFNIHLRHQIILLYLTVYSPPFSSLPFTSSVTFLFFSSVFGFLIPSYASYSF